MEGYQLIWEEKFNVLDDSVWSFDLGRGYNGWGNSESQYYTKENASFGDGLLITGKKELPPDAAEENRQGGMYGFDFTSSKLHTRHKKHFKYGYFEFDLEYPLGKGSWPAIWMMPARDCQWPSGGEIDLFEHIGRMEGIIHHSLHTEKYNFKNDESHYTSQYGVKTNRLTIGMEWTDKFFKFFVDGKPTTEFVKGMDGRGTDYASWPFDQEYYLIINLAIGGYWGKEIDVDSLPFQFRVGGIRYYQKR